MEKQSILLTLVKPIVQSKDVFETLKGEKLLELLFEEGYTTFKELKDDSNLNGIVFGKENGDMKDNIFINLSYVDGSLNKIELRYNNEFHILSNLNGIWYTTAYKHLCDSTNDGFPEDVYSESELVISDDKKYVVTYDRSVSVIGDILVNKNAIENKEALIGTVGDVSLFALTDKIDDEGDAMYERVASYSPIRNEICLRHTNGDCVRGNTRIVLNGYPEELLPQIVKIIQKSYYTYSIKEDREIPSISGMCIVTCTNKAWREVLTVIDNQNIQLGVDMTKDDCQSMETNMVIQFINGELSVDNDYVSKNYDEAIKTRNNSIISGIVAALDANDYNYTDAYTDCVAYLKENNYEIVEFVLDLLLLHFITKDGNEDKINIAQTKVTLKETESRDIDTENNIHLMLPLVQKAFNEYNIK